MFNSHESNSYTNITTGGDTHQHNHAPPSASAKYYAALKKECYKSIIHQVPRIGGVPWSTSLTIYRDHQRDTIVMAFLVETGKKVHEFTYDCCRYSLSKEQLDFAKREGIGADSDWGSYDGEPIWSVPVKQHPEVWFQFAIYDLTKSVIAESILEQNSEILLKLQNGDYHK